MLVTALCRVLARKGIRVAPFKPQNMALNSAVTREGGEIGRAQALQALAAGVEPHTDMNPVLLKPSSDTGAQVIIHGLPCAEMQAREFHDYKTVAMQAVLESHDRLSSQFDYVVVEGAGSPAEINLRDKDIANMGFAEEVRCPVLLVADIDRGGVFAHLVGTLQLLAPSEQELIAGFVINKFRGDIGLLQPGIDWLEEYTGKPVLGVLPYLQGLYLDAEDAIASEQLLDSREKTIKVAVPVFSRISNHTDFDALRLHPRVDLQFVGPGQLPSAADLIILPGSKNVRGDLQWLRDNGWDRYIDRHLRYGGKLMGVCGGYQMLGYEITDPEGIESEAGSSAGLGLLDLYTELRPQKQLRKVSGVIRCSAAGGEALVEGYEIHCGESSGAALANHPVTLSDGRSDGALSDDGQILGTYLHGLFDQPGARDALLQWAGLDYSPQPSVDTLRENQIERLADAVEEALDVQALFPELYT